MRKHLIIGASGQLGEHLLRSLRARGLEVSGTSWQHGAPNLVPLDIRDAAAVSTHIQQIHPDVVYLPAALTNVDRCEMEPELAYAINVAGVCNVVRVTKEICSKLVYFSSDYVFDGKRGPYSEVDPARPICEYGKHKLMAEHYVALHACDYLIVRTTVVYGWESQGKNFVQRLVNSLRKGDQVVVPVDQVGSPTYAPNLAEATAELVELDARGVYHIVGPRLANRYDLAVAVANVFGLDAGLIQPVATSQLHQVAPRPLNAGMTVQKAQSVLRTRLVDYEEGLTMMVN